LQGPLHPHSIQDLLNLALGVESEATEEAIQHPIEENIEKSTIFLHNISLTVEKCALFDAGANGHLLS